MADALDAFTLDGIRHNIPFLSPDGASALARRTAVHRLHAQQYPKRLPGRHSERGRTASPGGRSKHDGTRERHRLSRLAANPRPIGRDWVLALGDEQISVRWTRRSSRRG
jgi:hypothetical protein